MAGAWKLLELCQALAVVALGVAGCTKLWRRFRARAADAPQLDKVHAAFLSQLSGVQQEVASKLAASLCALLPEYGAQASLHPSNYLESLELLFGSCVSAPGDAACTAVSLRAASTLNMFDVCRQVSILTDPEHSTALNYWGLLWAVALPDMLCLWAARLPGDVLTNLAELMSLAPGGGSSAVSWSRRNLSRSELLMSSGAPMDTNREHRLLEDFTQYVRSGAALKGVHFKHALAAMGAAGRAAFGAGVLLTPTHGSTTWVSTFLSCLPNAKGLDVIIATPYEYVPMVQRLRDAPGVTFLQDALQRDVSSAVSVEHIVQAVEAACDAGDSGRPLLVLASSCIRLGGRFLDLRPLVALCKRFDNLHLLIDASADHRVLHLTEDLTPDQCRLAILYSKRVAGTGHGIVVHWPAFASGLELQNAVFDSSSIDIRALCRSITFFMAAATGVGISFEELVLQPHLRSEQLAQHPYQLCSQLRRAVAAEHEFPHIHQHMRIHEALVSDDELRAASVAWAGLVLPVQVDPGLSPAAITYVRRKLERHNIRIDVHDYNAREPAASSSWFTSKDLCESTPLAREYHRCVRFMLPPMLAADVFKVDVLAVLDKALGKWVSKYETALCRRYRRAEHKRLRREYFEIYGDALLESYLRQDLPRMTSEFYSQQYAASFDAAVAASSSSNSPVHIYYFQPGKRPMGMIIGQQLPAACIRDQQQAPWFYISEVFVGPKYQRLGIAGKLTDHFAEAVLQEGRASLVLVTRRDNQWAINMYCKFGFTLADDLESLRRTFDVDALERYIVGLGAGPLQVMRRLQNDTSEPVVSYVIFTRVGRLFLSAD